VALDSSSRTGNLFCAKSRFFISVLKAKVKSRNVQLGFAGVLRNWASSLNVKGGNKKPAKHKTTLNSNVFNLQSELELRVQLAMSLS